MHMCLFCPSQGGRNWTLGAHRRLFIRGQYEVPAGRRCSALPSVKSLVPGHRGLAVSVKTRMVYLSGWREGRNQDWNAASALPLKPLVWAKPDQPQPWELRSPHLLSPYVPRALRVFHLHNNPIPRQLMEGRLRHREVPSLPEVAPLVGGGAGIRTQPA